MWCVETVNRRDIQIPCPNEAIGYYRDDETYEMRRYPMCAAHAAHYKHNINPELEEKAKEAIKHAVNQARMEKAGKLMEAIASDDGSV